MAINIMRKIVMTDGSVIDFARHPNYELFPLKPYEQEFSFLNNKKKDKVNIAVDLPKGIEGTIAKQNINKYSQMPMLQRLMAAANNICGLCGEPIERSTDASIDHVIPVSRGGKNMDNRIAVHKLCNNKKGSRMPTACELLFLAMVNSKLNEG